jgi:DNA invertase Pin-like site-specific DNA recombinase
MGDHGSLLRRAVERVESRESDGVVVARVTHLGRSLEETIAAVERIEAAGGRFVSVCDGVDLGTASGRLVLRVLLSVLEWRDHPMTSPIRPGYAMSCVA